MAIDEATKEHSSALSQRDALQVLVSRTNVLLTRPEAAHALGVGLRTLDQLLADGEIAVVRIGAAVRIRPSAIEYFCEARETNLSAKRRKAIRGSKK